jgi:hypothetical protein
MSLAYVFEGLDWLRWLSELRLDVLQIGGYFGDVHCDAGWRVGWAGGAGREDDCGIPLTHWFFTPLKV